MRESLLNKMNRYEQLAMNNNFADDWREDVYVELIRYLQYCSDTKQKASLNGFGKILDDFARKAGAITTNAPVATTKTVPRRRIPECPM